MPFSERFTTQITPEKQKHPWEGVSEHERQTILEIYQRRLTEVLRDEPERERRERLKLVGMSQKACDRYLDLEKQKGNHTTKDEKEFTRLSERLARLEEEFETQEAAEKARWIENANRMILNEQGDAGLTQADLENPTEATKTKIRQIWMNKPAYASGKLMRAHDGSRTLVASPDFDIMATLGIMRMADIRKTVDYVEPGKGVTGGLNIDFGDKTEFDYDPITKTAFCDHHGKYKKRMKKRSSAEIVYTVLAGQHLFPEGADFNAFISFVTKMDNYQFPPEEFVRSFRTAVGFSRSIPIEKLIALFSHHTEGQMRVFDDSELMQLNLHEKSREQQKMVEDSIIQAHLMSTELSSAYQRPTAYGTVLLNEYNILKAGARAAYLCNDGIINFTPGKSFNISFKNAHLNRNRLRDTLRQHDPSKKFQGKIIHGSIWMYNGNAPLNLTMEDLLAALQ